MNRRVPNRSSSWLPFAGVGALALTLLATGFFARHDWVPVVVVGIWLVTSAVVGALIAVNRPANPVGLLMISAPLVIALGLFSEAYASYIYELGHSDLPGGQIAVWLTLWLTVPGFALFIHLLLRFPTGRVPSPGWRWVSRLATLALIINALGFAFRPGPVDNVRVVDNPLGTLLPRWVSEFGISVGDSLLPLSGFLAIASLFLRFRRADRTERQQMKWFVLAVSVFPVLFLVSQFASALDESEDEYFAFILVMSALLFVPVSMGIGILRHKLYDIDVVVNRALVYAGLTAILASAYLAIVVLLQSVLRPLTPESDLAVAASTLAVAALFRPVRRRVQTFIDQRFFRRKYDTAETLGAFSARLRDQVDLESLSSELVGVVGSTMQPAHASIWLRPTETP